MVFKNESRVVAISRLSLVSLLMTASLSVQSSDSNSNELEEIVTIANRSEVTSDQVAGSVSLVSESELRRISAVHIQQVLSQVPGVVSQRGNGQESLPGVRSAVLTGAGACGSVLTLEEAIPVRGPGFCNVNELFDTHFEQAGHVEVVRGPGSVFFGSNALTGSINVSLPVDGVDRVGVELGTNQYRRLYSSLGYGDTGADKSSGNGGRLFITLTEDGGFRDDSGYDQQKLSWRHRQTLGGWTLHSGATLTRLDQETAGFIVGENSFLDDDLIRRNLDPEAFRNTVSARAWTRAQTDINDKRTLQVTPYVRYTDMDFLLHFLPGDPLEENSQRGIGWQSSISTQTSERFSWTLGLDADFSTGALRQSQDAPTQGSAFLQETIPEGLQYDYSVNSVQLALFGQFNWQLQPRWQLNAGLRLERLSYDYDNLTLTGRSREDGSECGFGGCRFNRPADSRDSFTNLSPQIALRYQVNDRLNLQAKLSTAFRAPQATELYRLQGDQSIADLDSVRATNVELAAQYRSERFSLDVSAYQLIQRNLIIRDSDSFNVDGAATDSVGLEVSLRHQFAPAWSWRLTGALARHEYAADQFAGDININGNDVDTAPRESGNLFLAWQQPKGRWDAELQIQYLGEYFLDLENANQYPGHTLVNLRGAYRLNNRWNMSLRLLNVADRRYAERADFTSFTGQRFFPGESRSLFGSVEYQF